MDTEDDREEVEEEEDGIWGPRIEQSLYMHMHMHMHMHVHIHIHIHIHMHIHMHMKKSCTSGREGGREANCQQISLEEPPYLSLTP